MAQIVNVEVVEARTCSDAPPRVLKVSQMTVLLAAGDDLRIVTPSLDGAQHGDGRFAEMDDLGTGFRFRQLELPGLQVDMLQRSSWISDSRQPVSMRSRIAAIAAGVSERSCSISRRADPRR